MRREARSDALSLPYLELLEPRLLLAGNSGYADLLVWDAFGPATASLGDEVWVTWGVENQGAADALGPWADAVYFSDDAVLNLPQGGGDGGDRQLALTTSEVLAAGQTYTVTYPVVLPDSGSGGTCYLLFVTDVDDSVLESDEANNVLAVPIEIIPPDVDLTITDAAAAPTSLRLSEPFGLFWTVTNQGCEAAQGYWQDWVFYSTDSVLDPGDVCIGGSIGGGEGGLPGGGTYDGYMGPSLPGGIPEGPGHLLIVTDAARQFPETDETNNTFALPITVTVPDVDLQVTEATGPSSGLLGGKVDVSWTVRNFGSEYAFADWHDTIYVSSDATLDPSDVHAGTAWIERQTPLAGGASYAIDNLSVSIPNDAPRGAVYLLCVADRHNYQGETDDTNNVLAVPITIVPPDVDLVITSTTAPETVLVGQCLTVSWTGTNQGGVATQASGWSDRVYYSDDDLLDRRDTELACGGVDRAVPAGGTYAFSDIAIWIPSTAAPGMHYLLFVADVGNLQPETNETNNILVVPVAVERSAADLAITDVTVPTSVLVGQRVPISWKGVNQGTTPTTLQAWWDAVYYSEDDVLDGSDPAIGSMNIWGPVAAGAAYDSGSTTVSIPATATPGTRYLFVKADIDRREPETDETNNVYRVQITVASADLAVKAATVPSAATLGDTISVSWTVANQGVGAAANWSDGVYLSRTAAFDRATAISLLSERLTGPVASGAEYTLDRNVTLPRSLPGGPYYLLFVADAANELKEPDETNNVLALPIDISGADLVVTAASVTPTSSSLGATVHVSFTVTNQGTAPAKGTYWGASYGWGWWDSVYLSAYPDLSGASVLADSFWSGPATPLAAGASYTVERDVALPNSLPPGELHLLFAADRSQWSSRDNLQGETDETNNRRVVPITVGGPDLVVSAANAPASVALSSVVEVSWTVANEGGEPARGSWIDALYFSTDPVLGGNDIYVVSAGNVAPLPAGGNYIDTCTVFIPTVALGDGYLLFVVDRLNQQGETDETNNVRALPIKIVAPDLVVTEATAPASAIVGQRISISWTVADQGDGPAQAKWYDSVWLSTDPFIDDCDALVDVIDQAARSPLAAGATYTTARTITVPNVGVGDFYILLVADRRYDGHGLQGESNETNNTLALPIHLQAPDLQVTAAAAPDTAVASSTVVVSFTVANTGLVTAPAIWSDAVYVCDDPVQGDRWLAGRWSNAGWTPLAAGDSYTRSVAITLPTSAIGQKYLLFVADDDGAQGETNNANNTYAVPILVVAPDLVVSEVSASVSSASPGETFRVSWTVLNQGSTPAPADWHDYVYLSKDAALDVGDLEAEKEPVSTQTPLAAGAAYTITRDITFPNADPGNWYLLFVVDRFNDQGETDETNNVRAVPITVTVPDLKVTAASAPPAATLGQTIGVSWTVTNVGNVAARTRWYDAVCLSADATLDAFDMYLCFKDASANVPLAPGASYTVDLTFQVPQFQTGPCWLIFVADADCNQQAESDETNNPFALPITLSAPDLAVTGATAPASAILGQKVDLSWTVANQGTAATAANWVDAVYIGRSAAFDGTTRRLATVPGKPLAPGADYLATASVTIPDVGTGPFFLLVVADADRDQAETNEANNLRAAPITLSAPDFVVTGASAPSVAAFGQTVDLSWTVANRGPVPTAVPVWYDSIYLSRDSTFSGDDLWIASVDESGRAPLAPGASYTASHTLSMPVSIPDVGTGDAYWLFVADWYGISNTENLNNLQGETDETNNVFAAPLRIERPDLEITAVASPATGTVCGAVEVSWTVTNTGSVPALAEWTDAVYLSSDPNLDLGDWRLAEWSAAARTPLAGGGHYDVTQTVFIPNLGLGPRYLILVTDRDNAQGETREDNNLRVVPIQIAAPDLTVTAASAAPSASLGQRISVTWTVLNQGAAEAPNGWSDTVFLSTDPVWDASDVLLATADASAYAMLAAGSSYTRTWPVTIPDFALGDQYLLFYTDRGDRQGETDEANNVFAVPLCLTAADLQIANLTVTPAALKSGESLTIRWEDVNTGTGPTPGRFYDRIVVRNTTTGQTLPAAMFAYEPHFGECIAPGQSLAREYAYRLPDGPPGVGQIEVTVTTDGGQDAGPKGDVIEYNPSGTGETNNSASAGAASVLAPYPDLVVTDISAPPEAVSGQLVPITWTVANLGDGPAVGPWGDTVYLSADTTAGGDQWVGDFGSSGTVAPGESVTQTLAVFVPITSAGDWHVVVETNSGQAFYEHARANNTLVDDQVLPVRMAPLPDLQVQEIRPPTHPYAGQQTVIEWTVTNTGTGSTNAAAWTDAVWLSADATWSGGDLLLGEVPNGSYLGVDESYASSLTVTLPVALEGQVYFVVQADRYNVVYELVENDNVAAAGPVEVQPTAPADLQVTSVMAPAVAFSGQPLLVTWQVSNEGIGPTLSDYWLDEVYLSTDTTVDASDAWLGSARPKGALEAGGRYDVSKAFTLPVDRSGDFYVIVVTDLRNYVYERGGETNNGRATNSTTKVHLVAPDLQVTSVTAPPTALAGGYLTIGYETGNTGTSGTPIPCWVNAVYLSPDDQWQSGDLRLGTSTHNVYLDAGRTAEGSFTGRLPDGLSGLFYVFVVGDAYGNVFELDETNNVSPAGGPIMVESKPADLVVSAVEAPGMAEAGGAIRVNWTVSNHGTGAPSTESWCDEVILSTDPVLDPADLVLLIVPNDRSPEPGQSYSRSALVGIPWYVVGNCTLFVVADGNKSVYESDESNNASGRPLWIERRLADLAVTDVTADTSALSGGGLAVAWHVRNVGAGRGNASFWYDAVYLWNGTSDILLGAVSHGDRLSPDTSYGASVTFGLPAELSGTFYVKVQAGVYSGMIEDNRDNNVCLSEAPTVITLAPTPDLVVPSVDAPAEAISGQRFSLTWTVRNDGAAPAGGWTDAVYLSRDLLFGPGVDTYVGNRNSEGGLAVGEFCTATQSFDVPLGFSGLFYVIVVTDPGNHILERGGENNNAGVDPYAMLVTLAPPADLVVGTITLPANAVPGQPVAITYTVANQGQNAARGHWYDSLYVSTDNQWDIGDALVGRVHHQGDVAAGADYTETLRAPVPGVLPGDYAVIVRTDIRNHVAETNEANNIGASLDRVAIDAEALTIDVPAEGQIATGQSVYYRLDVPRDRTLELTFDSDYDLASSELYVRFGQMPTRGVFDYSYSQPYEPDQKIVVPTTQEGTYYVLAYAAYSPDGSTYTLTGHLLEFGLTALVPATVGNGGPATLEITGALLGPTMSYELVDPTGAAVLASAVYFVDATRVYATFDLTGLPVGAYLARVTRPDGAVADLAAAVAVTVGVGPKLQAGLYVPPVVRPGPLTVTLEYQNTGDADLVSPLLDVTGPAQVMFGLRFGQETAQGGIRVLGYSPTGPAGVLRPGQRESIPLYCSRLPAGTHAFGLTTLIVDPNDPTPEPVAWDSLGQASHPPFADPQEWQAILTVFSAQAGASWQESLAHMARQLTANPYLPDGTPNILVDDLFEKAFTDALSRGGGLTDHELPWVLTHLVSAQGGAPESVELVFSKSIDPASFTPASLTLTDPSGAAIAPLAVTEVCDRLFRVTFAAQSMPGTYHLLLAPDVADTVDQRLDQDRDGRPGEATDDVYDASFRVAPGGAAAGQLYVTSHTPAGLRDQREGVDHVTVNFSQPIYFQTFTPADVQIAGPAGAIRPTAVTQLSATAYRIDFPRQDAVGTYSVSVGPDIIWLAGKKMDQNADGVDGFAGNDRYVATFQIADIHGPRIVAYSPDGWMDQAVNTIEVTFSEPIRAETFTLAQVSVTGPDGPIVPSGVTHVSDTVFQVTMPWQSAPPDYAFTVGPDIRDVTDNAMDQNQDDVNGTAYDAFTGTFHILDGVQLNPLPSEPQGARSALLLTDPPPAWVAPVSIWGRVVYHTLTELAKHFPNGAHLAVQLWEEVGNRDLTFGKPDPPDPPDKLISTTNALTKSDLLDDVGRFIFEKDTSGNPILNVDLGGPAPGSMAKYYVVVLAKNAYGFVVEEDSVDPTEPADLAQKPWLTPLHPAGLPQGLTSEEWGRLYADTTASPVVEMKPPSSAEVPYVGYTMPDIEVFNDEFGLAEWVRYAALWLQKAAGVPPRRTIAIVVPWTKGVDAGPDNACHWSWDYISVGANAIALPAVILHEYGHALQFFANNYANPPGGSCPYGIIQEGSYQTKAFKEAWASFVAAKVLDSKGTVLPKGSPRTLVRALYNRSGQFLWVNNFWMGYDAYGFASNGAAGDMDIDADALDGLFTANGINTDANTGANVMGAVESILWALAMGGVGIGGVWEAMKTATLAGGTSWDFYNALTKAYPDAKREIDAIFIDNGIPVADDKYKDSVSVNLGPLSKPISLEGLIMSRPDEGGTDAFAFNLPATTDAKGDRTYTLVVRVEFAERYGDLDLKLTYIDPQSGDWKVPTDIKRAGSEAEIVIAGLHTKHNYDFSLDVFGHGAIMQDNSTNGGDFHPDYRLVIYTKFPGPQGKTPGRDDGVYRTNVVVAHDPNDILGPPGFGPEHWIPAAQAIPYTIRFENSPQAGASARQVAVTQRLDPDLDWRSFRIGDFGWGNVYIHVPENRAFYSERLDLRDTMGIYVDAAAGIDIASGQAFWTLTAIDPATGEMPTRTTAGLLPPNDDTGRGQGFVSYTVRPSAGAATGTVIDPLATIVFDTEPPIDTPPIFNTLDAAAPSSAVAPLPAIAAGEEFLVRWSGADAPGGSGLGSCTVYVSDNGGPFQPWLSDTALTEAPFAGKRGHTYAFYSTSRDNAGNAESAPAAADALTTVPNTAPQVILGGDATLAEGTLFTRTGEIIDPDIGDAWTATVDYDDGAGAQPLALAGKTFDLSHLYAENGVYHVQVTVTDSCGASGSGTVALTVNNVAPTLTSLSGDTLVTRGGTASFSAAATDPGNDNLIYTWDFGDGSAPSAGPNASHVFAKAGDYTVSLTVDDGDGGRASGTLAVKVLSEPAVMAVQIGDGAAQRSMVKAVTVTFDQAVTLATGAVVVTRSDGLSIAAGVTNPPGDQRTYVLTFGGPGTCSGSLSDGRYQIKVVAAKVTNSAGGPMAADAVSNIHRFFGDSDGDGDVDVKDYQAFSRSYNRPSTSSLYRWYFDYNSDNRVNTNDLSQFRTRMGKNVDRVVHVVPGQVNVIIENGQKQRSQVDGITVAFDRQVMFDPGAFEVVRDDGMVVSVTATLAADARSVKLTFTGPDIVAGSLADGVYTLNVHRGMIRNLAGDAIGTGDLTQRFHRLFGDIDGDGDVDRLDYGTIRGALGSSLGDTNYSRLYDADGDGDVDALDLAAMRSRLGKKLTV